MKIRLGDTVVIISGKDKGKQGSVVRILAEQNRVVVEGINMRIRHIKRTENQAGQRVSYEASIHASNLMLVDPKTKKPTRIGYKIDEKTGKKARFAKLSGEIITKAAAVKAPKKGTKAAQGTKAEKETGETKEPKKDAKNPAAPTKQPFWKRSAKGDAGQTGGSAGGPDSNVIQTAHRSQGG